MPFPDAAVTAHLRLGMVGRVSVGRHRRALGADGVPTHQPPAAAGLRWRLLTSSTSPTSRRRPFCEWLDAGRVAALHAPRPDPLLRPDADPESFRRKVSRSRLSHRSTLLQSVIAGVGRPSIARILWRLRIRSPASGQRPRHRPDRALVEHEAATLLDLGLGRAGSSPTMPSCAPPERFSSAVSGCPVGRVCRVWPRSQPCRVCATRPRGSDGSTAHFLVPRVSNLPGRRRPRDPGT